MIKIATIDGMTFEKSRSHQLQSQRGGYNNLRSHNYFIFKLAEALGETEISNATVSGECDSLLNPNDDVAYTKKEFPGIEFTTCKLDREAEYGILIQMLINLDNLDRIEKFVDSVEKLIIYTSDYDYEVRSNTYGRCFIMEFLRRNDPEHLPLITKIKSKLKVVINGWYHISKLVPSMTGSPSVFFPQVINPNIPVSKPSFDRPFDGFFMGMNDDTVKFMKDSIDKTFLSVQYRDYVVHHGDFRNVTQVLQAGISMDLTTLIGLTSMCKFHPWTNSWKSLYPTLTFNSDMVVNQTFKIFEAYYGGMYPIAPDKSPEQLHAIMDTDRDTYNRLTSNFISEMQENYSFESYIDTFDEILELIK